MTHLPRPDTPQHYPIEFAPKRLDKIPLTAINVLPQVRQHYPEEHIAELATSMRFESNDGRVDFELINSLTIAQLSPPEAIDYMQEHSQHYGVTTDPTTLQPHDGYYFILIAGHCRRLAIIQNCDEDSIPYDEVIVGISPKQGITFEDALALQIRENFHLRPSPQEDALSIGRYYNLRAKREGTPPSYADCSRILGYSASKIADALRFYRLPKVIQEFASPERTLITYGTLLLLEPLLDAYVLYYKRRAEAEGEDCSRDQAYGLAQESVVHFALSLVSKRIQDSKAPLADIIRGKTEEIKGKAQYITGELFLCETDATTRRNTSRVMGKLAINALLYRLGNDELTPWEAKQIVTLAAVIEARDKATNRDYLP